MKIESPLDKFRTAFTTGDFINYKVINLKLSL